MENIKYENLIEIYKVINDQELKFAQQANTSNRVTSGMLITIIGSILIINEKFSDKIIIVFASIIGGILVIVIGELAKTIAKNYARRSYENLARRVKMEYLLNFKTLTHKILWGEEGLILFRHMKDVEKFNSSEEFVNHLLKSGIIKTINFYYIIMQIIGLMGIFLGIYHLFNYCVSNFFLRVLFKGIFN
jgi:hypothetical protein